MFLREWERENQNPLTTESHARQLMHYVTQLPCTFAAYALVQDILV